MTSGDKCMLECMIVSNRIELYSWLVLYSWFGHNCVRLCAVNDCKSVPCGTVLSVALTVMAYSFISSYFIRLHLIRSDCIIRHQIHSNHTEPTEPENNSCRKLLNTVEHHRVLRSIAVHCDEICVSDFRQFHEKADRSRQFYTILYVSVDCIIVFQLFSAFLNSNFFWLCLLATSRAHKLR